MEDYYEYLDSNGVTTLYKLIKDDTVALIDSYSVTINGITTTLDSHVNNTDIHTPISDIENMVDTKVSGLVNSAPETLDTLKELSDALGNDPNFATTVANQIGNKASKDDVYTKEETDTLLEGKADSVHNHVVKDITDFPTIPTKTSELSNDSNFVTSTELHDYATKNDLNSKQDALSEEQLSNIDSIPDKANKSDLSTVATSGSYKDLLDKPVLPEGADLSDYYNKGETDNLLNSKANTSDLAVVAKSGNYNDLNNTPTIPTKLSQLENDMGFGTGSGGVITSISWTNITDKPNFATVATSGSYTDLSNTPTIPTKVSQLENDTGFINALNDVVDTKSNQTINGTKTFTVAPIVSNNATTNGYAVKLNAIARNEVPSTTYYSVLRTVDKNNEILGDYVVMKTNKGATNAQINIRSEDSNGNQLINAVNFSMANDNSSVSFAPSVSNKVSLGTSTYKWAKIYSDDVVHTSGDENISGNKYFTQDVNVKNSDVDIAVTPSSNLFSCFRFRGKDNVTTASIQYSQRTYGVNDICFYVFDADSNSHGFRIRTDNRLEPIENNTYSLGSSSSKWSDFYSTNAYISNIYTNRVTSYSITHPSGDNNSYFFMSGGSDYDKGATLYLGGISATNFTPGRFALAARKTDGSSVELAGSPNGTLTWGGKNVAIDENLVHTSGTENISGNKIFRDTLFRKSDITTSTADIVYRFEDSNDTSCGYIQNNVHYWQNNLHNRHIAHNNTSGKEIYLDIISKNNGTGTINIGGNVTSVDNISGVTSDTNSARVATMGWVNNPATSTNVVHRSGDETINGNKTFTNQLYLGAGGTSYGQISAKDNNSILRLFGGTSAGTGANLDLYGEGVSSGGFSLRARTSDKIVGLDGKTDGTLKWNGKNVAIDENLVHTSGDETINGSKSFTSEVYRMNTSVDRTTTPSQNLYSTFTFLDKARLSVGSIQHCQRTSGVNDLSFYVTGNSNVSYGVRINSNKEFSPIENNAYSLGSTSNQWANVYAARINCDNIVRTVENSYIYMTAGPAWNNGASIFLNGKSGDGLGTGKGTFLLFARDGTNERRLLGYPNGLLSWNGCIESHEFRSTTGNAFMAQYGSYTFLIRNDGSNTYFLMSDKDGTPGTWSTARPLIIDNATGVCNISGNANSATYATTQATTDNSTRIATTAWVRNYVNSVGGSGNNTLGSSISAYWSTSSVVTNTKQASNEKKYPECYSSYIDRTPGVGIIYSGAQLYTRLDVSASATGTLGGSVQDRRYITSVTAQATFSNPISPTGKYLCTTANTVSFRAYAPGGNSEGTASVINNTSTKSIFIRVE